MKVFYSIKDAYDDGKCCSEQMSEEDIRSMVIQFEGVDESNVKQYIKAFIKGQEVKKHNASFRDIAQMVRAHPMLRFNSLCPGHEIF